MAQLQILTQFVQLFDDVKNSLNNYNENLQNELFEKEPNESNEKAYRRGETIFDQCENDLRNLNEIVDQQDEINNFFEKCKQNKIKLIEQKNELINKLLRIKKNDKKVSKEEYLNLREEWNKKREETKDEKNRRECEEMLEEIKEEKKLVEEIKEDIVKEKNELNDVKKELESVVEKAKKEKENLDVKEEFNKVASEYVKKSEFGDQLEIEQRRLEEQKRLKQLEIEQRRQKELEERYNKLKLKLNLNGDQVGVLEEWTELKCGEILFDSNVDNWKNSSVLNERIIGKSKLTFVIENTDGEIFGYYLNTQVVEKYGLQETDSKSFKFNLQSNGRLKEPMKFEINDLIWGGIYLWEKTDGNLINLGDIRLWKENLKNESNCEQHNDRFDYHGIKKALCGKEPNKYGDMNFTPKKILVIQMQ